MATITESIGTSGRDFSTLQAWEDAIPANLVSAGDSYVGECYNDSEFTYSTAKALTIAGQTTNASNFITLKCAAGESFKDHPDVQAQTTPLRYDVAKGVGIKGAGAYADLAFQVSNVHYTVIDGLQFQAPSDNSHQGLVSIQADGAAIQNCILGGAISAAGGAHLTLGGFFGGVPLTARNCLIYGHGTGNGGQISANGHLGPQRIVNCTIAHASDGGSPGSRTFVHTFTSSGVAYNGPGIILNCAIFGDRSAVTDNTDRWDAAESDYNATNLASVGFGSNNLTSLTYADQFENTSAATPDYRLKAGSALIDSGDGVNGASFLPAEIDIAMTSRPQGSGWDIGAWELIQAAAGSVGRGLTKSILLGRRALTS